MHLFTVMRIKENCKCVRQLVLGLKCPVNRIGSPQDNYVCVLTCIIMCVLMRACVCLCANLCTLLPCLERRLPAKR